MGATSLTLRGTGVWSHELRIGEPAVVGAAAAELEDLGFTALWVPQLGRDLLQVVQRILADTATAVIATSILNVWEHTPDEVGAWWASLPDTSRSRLMLGVGVGHKQAVGAAWTKPIGTMSAYLDGLDAAGVPTSHRCIAAQGPKMIALARDRAAGAHPYLVTPEHTRRAREILGSNALLAPEQKVILESDPLVARAIARENLANYWNLTNYTNNWKRLGFTDDDITTRSDALIDALVVWGDLEAIAQRLDEHRVAGADHVSVRVLQTRGQPMPRSAWRDLAAVIK